MRNKQVYRKAMVLAVLVVGAILSTGQSQCNIPTDGFSTNNLLGKFLCTLDLGHSDWFKGRTLSFYDNGTVCVSGVGFATKCYPYYVENDGYIIFISDENELFGTNWRLGLRPAYASISQATEIYGTAQNVWGTWDVKGERIE